MAGRVRLVAAWFCLLNAWFAMPARAQSRFGERDLSVRGEHAVQRTVSQDDGFELFVPDNPSGELTILYLDERASRSAFEGLALHLATHGAQVALARQAPSRSAIVALSQERGFLSPRVLVLAVGKVSKAALDNLPHGMWVDAVLLDPEGDETGDVVRAPADHVELLLLSSAPGSCSRREPAWLGSATSFYGLVRLQLAHERLCEGQVPPLARKLLTGVLAYGERFDAVSDTKQRWSTAYPQDLAIDREPSSAERVPQFNLSAIVFGDYAHQPNGWQPGLGIGFRPELLFGRSSNRSWGYGPFLQVSRSSNASGVLLGGGGTLLVPLWVREGFFESVVLAPSLGFYAQKLQGFEPGLSSSVFFGYRTFNPISSFDFTLGMTLGGHWGLGASHERSLSLGLQLDLTLIVAAFAG